MQYFSFNLTFLFNRITWLFCNIRMLIWLIICFDLLSLLIVDMFDTLLIITLFLLASLLVCLLTLRLNINIKHLCPFSKSLPILLDFLKFQPSAPPFILTLPFIKFKKNLRPREPHLLWPPCLLGT